MVKNVQTTLTPKTLTLGVLLSALIFTGCQQTVAPLKDGGMTSKEGVKLEAAIPADAAVIIKLGTTDPDQVKLIKDLNAQFPADLTKEFSTGFNEGFKSGAKFEETGLSFEEDIMPLIGEQTEFVMAMAPGKKDGLNKPEIMASMTLADKGKFDALIAKLKDVTKEDYKGNTVYTAKSEDGSLNVFTRYKDTVLLSDSVENLKVILDRVVSGKSLVAAKPGYVKAMKDLKPNVAMVYVDLAAITGQMAIDNPQEIKSMTKSLGMFGVPTDSLEVLDTEVLFATAEKDGIRLNASLYAKEGADMSKLTTNGQKFYLAKDIPGKSPLLYTEGQGFKEAYGNILSAMEGDQDVKQGMDQVRTALKQVGLDFDQDVMGVMDKGIAMVLADNGSILPSLGFYIDASSKPDSAKKIAGVLNTMLTNGIAEVQVQNPEAAALIDKLDVEADKLWKVKVNVDPLLMSAPESIVKKLTGQKVELYLGLVGNNILALALHPDLEKTYAKGGDVVANAAEFKRALEFIKGNDLTVTYLAPAAVFDYLDRIMQLAKDSGAAIDMTDYDQVRSLVRPVKSIIMGYGGFANGVARSEIFVHIGQ